MVESLLWTTRFKKPKKLCKWHSTRIKIISRSRFRWAGKSVFKRDNNTRSSKSLTLALKTPLKKSTRC